MVNILAQSPLPYENNKTFLFLTSNPEVKRLTRQEYSDPV